MNKEIIFIFLMLLSLAPGQVLGLSDYWMVGFDGEIMFPMLSGGVLECGVGESLSVKLVGRDGMVSLQSPSGSTESVSLQDGVRKVLKRFGLNDVGEWIITTDEGIQTKIVVKPPVVKPSVNFYLKIEDGRLVITAESPPQSYVLFLESEKGDAKRAGTTILIPGQNINETRVKAEILRKEPPIRINGYLEGVPYQLEVEQLVAQIIVTSVSRNGSRFFPITIPSENQSVTGFRRIGVGAHIIRLVSLSTNRILYETEVVVVPSSARHLEGLGRSVVVDFWSAMRRNYTVVVGDEIGNVWVFRLRPPVAMLLLYDVTHGRYYENAEITLVDSLMQKIGDVTFTAFTTWLEVVEYDNRTFLTPSRQAVVSLFFGAASINTPPISVKSGDVVTLNASLYYAYIKLVWPNGTVYSGDRMVEVNGWITSHTDNLVFPSGDYVVRAVKPESFFKETFTLKTDTTWTVVVVDDPVGLASLRASAVLFVALLVYVTLKTIRLRNTFYRPRAQSGENI